MIASFILTLAAAAPVQVAAPHPRIVAIRAQLWLETTGRLSDDILRPDFAGWNSIIGEGSAGEPANDLLISVQLRTAGEQLMPGPLEIKVTRGSRGTVATRRFERDLLAHEGSVWKAIWLKDVGCAGRCG